MIRLLALALVALGALARAAAAEETVHGLLVRAAGSDRFAAAEAALLAEPVAGDLVAAGGELDIGAPVGGDLVVAGARLRLQSSVAQDLYAVGGRVALEGAVGRNARIAGGSVQIGPRARISGGTSLAGGDVNVLGALEGYLQAAGARVYIDGTVGGDADIAAGEVELGPSARIGGTLRYASRRPIVLDPGAQVKGRIERRLAPLPHRAKGGVAHALRWFWSAGLVLLAGALVALAPGLSGAVAQAARRRLGWSLLLGFALLLCVPAAALLLLFTGVGAPLALLGLALYLALALAGYASAGIAFGEAVLARWIPARAAKLGWRIGAAASGTLAIEILARVPWLGAAVALLALLVGMGALGLQVRPREPAGGPAQAPGPAPSSSRGSA